MLIYKNLLTVAVYRFVSHNLLLFGAHINLLYLSVSLHCQRPKVLTTHNDKVHLSIYADKTNLSQTMVKTYFKINSILKHKIHSKILCPIAHYRSISNVCVHNGREGVS